VKRIVVGLDGTEKDDYVVDWVGDLARENGAQVIAAHFVPSATLWMIAGAQVDSAKYLEELREHLDADVLGELRRRVPMSHLHVAVGDPARELAAIARECRADLIAIGASSHTVWHEVVFGSLERRLVHLADVPVVEIPCRSPVLHLLH
jgi:nucleotide-binding universal stress UspA family protein